MWKELISSFTQDFEFFPPVDPGIVDSAEKSLQIEFPDSLVDFYRETNGALGEYGFGLVWPVEQVVRVNVEFRNFPDFRELYMPFDCLLFFGDAGNGDQFAFVITDGKIRRDDIFVWDHETDSRTWVAPRLETFLEHRLTGKLDI